MERNPLHSGALIALALVVVVAALVVALRTSGRFDATPAERGADASEPVAPVPAAQVAPAPVEPAAEPADQSAAARVPSVAEPAVEPAAPPALFVRGKVVDGRRFPVASVEVRLVRADGSSASATSDAAGRFEIPVATRPETNEPAQLRAARGEEVAVGTAWLAGTQPPRMRFLSSLPAREDAHDVDAGALVLRAATPLRVRASEAGAAAAGAEVRIGSPGSRLVHWRGTCDGAGIAVTPPLPPGPCDVVVQRGDSDGRARAFLPGEREVAVELAPCFDATVTVVARASGAPIEGAQVTLTEMVRVPASLEDQRSAGGNEYMTSLPSEGGKAITGADGIARFQRLSARADHRVAVTCAGYVPDSAHASSGQRLDPAQRAVRVELAPVETRTVSWPIEAGEVPVPEEGARIVLSPAPGTALAREQEPPPDPVGSVQGGQLVVDGIQGVGNFLATAPDGALARVHVAKDQATGQPISFRRPRTVEMLVRDPQGAPVEGAGMQVRNQGNNPLGEIARTDASGIARVGGLLGELSNVYVNHDGRELLAGTVDITKADARLEYVTASADPARACLELRSDGRAQIPGELRFTGEARARIVEERPERGEVVVLVARPKQGEAVELIVQAKGFLPAKVDVPIARDGGEPRVVVELVRNASLLVAVRRPAGEASIALKPERWNEQEATWESVMPYYNPLRTPNAHGGGFRFEQLAAGRYRALDDGSKIATEPVEVAAGEEGAALLDLADLEWVSGRVEAPDPAELARARVLTTTPGAPAAPLPQEPWMPGTPKGAIVAKDGTFRVPVRRGTPTRIAPWHPWLSPAPEGGEVELDGGREGVLLKLAEGDLIRIATPQAVSRRSVPALRVAVYPPGATGIPAGEPERWITAAVENGGVRFSGVPRGRWCLWLDPGHAFAPLFLRDVEVGAGVTDLGTVEFPRGSALRLRVKVDEGKVPPRMFVHARRTAAPILDRQHNSDGEAEVVLGGLEAGSYRVSWSSVAGTLAFQERTLEVDGTTDVVLEVEGN